MGWLYRVARFLCLLLKLLFNPTLIAQDEIITGNGSPVKFDDPNMDFVLKISIPDPMDDSGSTKKYHRVTLDRIIDPSTRRVHVDHLKDFLRARRPGEADFSYRDLDGDACTITTTDDLLEAIRQSSSRNHLKLEASFRGEPTNLTNTTSTSQQANENGNVNGSNKSIVPASSRTDRIMRAMEGPGEKEDRTKELDDLEEVSLEAIRPHIWEDFHDHYNLDHVKDFFPAKDSAGYDCGDAWIAMTRYQLHGRPVKSPYFAMDDVYIDLTLEPWPGGDNYVRLAIPSVLLYRIHDQVAGTSTPPPLPTALDPVVAAFDPYGVDFVTMGPDLVPTNHGLLSDVLQAGSHKHFYKASAMFFVTANKDPISLGVSLVEVIAFAAHDQVLERLYHNNDCMGDIDYDNLEDGMGSPEWTMNYTFYSDDYSDDYSDEYSEEEFF